MKVDDAEAKEELIHRLRRIEGQVRGVQRMIDEERNCREVLQQLSAIQAALRATTRVLARAYVSGCLADPQYADAAARELLVDDLVGLMGKAP